MQNDKSAATITSLQCTLSHHGAAASSSSHSLLWLPLNQNLASSTVGKDVLMYASHGIVNMATAWGTKELSTTTTRDKTAFENQREGNKQVVMNVIKTLRGEAGTTIDGGSKITCMCHIQDYANRDSSDDDSLTTSLACGYSHGAVNIWTTQKINSSTSVVNFVEEIVRQQSSENVHPKLQQQAAASFTDIAAMKNVPLTPGDNTDTAIVLATATSTGVVLYSRRADVLTTDTGSDKGGDSSANWTIQAVVTGSGGVSSPSTASVMLQKLHNADVVLFTGSAAPRGNRIRVFLLSPAVTMDAKAEIRHQGLWDVHPHGSLLGHQDWITCMDWTPLANNRDGSSGKSSYLLASGSHDAKIRLWRFHPVATAPTDSNVKVENEDEIIGENSNDDDDDDDDDDEEEEEIDESRLDNLYNGEARLIIHHPSSSSMSGKTTAATLEALLVGHDDIVTSVSWHPTSNMSSTPILLSSSMDRSILIWSEDVDAEGEGEGVWIPHARVGSAGGILGASLGSSLLGFVDAKWDPSGRAIVGHGYGGSLYFWCAKVDSGNKAGDKLTSSPQIMLYGDIPISSVSWEAEPPLTGHFRPVQDLSWEPTTGEYLLSVSTDQTCRLWTQVPTISTKPLWHEVGRPQVHGYDLSAVACIGVVGSQELLHRFVSGADEKQLRVFDAPLATLRLLDQLHGRRSSHTIEGAGMGRVEKAFLPSLGLSNKAGGDETYNEVYEMEVNDGISHMGASASIAELLPRERELGVSTLWPEVGKLYGHGSELICVASTAQSSSYVKGSHSPVLVASSCKARDVEQAAIRLWNVNRGTCLCVLKVRCNSGRSNHG